MYAPIQRRRFWRLSAAQAWPPVCGSIAKVAELVDALDLGSSGATRESSSLSFRTTTTPADSPV